MKKDRRFNRYYVDGDICYGYASNTGACFIFDTRFLVDVARYTWRENDQGYIKSQVRGVKNSVPYTKQLIHLHHLIFGRKPNFPVERIDHANRDKKDNRIHNLRICTPSENKINTDKAHNAVGNVAGISFKKRRGKISYEVRIWKNRICYYVGGFKDLHAAIGARKCKEKELYGEFSAPLA